MKTKEIANTNTVKLNVLIENPVINLFTGAFLGWLSSIFFVSDIPGSIIFLLLIVTVFCFLLSLYNTQQTQNILNLHVNRVEEILGSTNEVVAEPDIYGIHSAEYQGVCYKKIIELIGNAQKQIFVVPNPFRLGEIYSWDKDQREEYLKKVEEKIQNNPGFQYTRIQQVPKGYSGSLEKHFGKVATAHIERLLDKRSEGIYLKYIKSDEISGFMVIDNSILIKFITGIDSERKKVMVAITIQRNNCESNTVQEFCKRFCKILSESSDPITKKLLKDEC